jgi:hypothetical protein
VLASSYQQAGDPNRALSLVRGAMNAAPGNTGLLLQYAGILSAVRDCRTRIRSRTPNWASVMRRLAAIAAHAAATHRLRQSESRHRGEASRYGAPARRPGRRLRRDRAVARRHARQPRSASRAGRVCTPPPATTAMRSRVIARRWRRPDDIDLQVAAIGAATGAKNFRLPRQRRIRRCAQRLTTRRARRDRPHVSRRGQAFAGIALFAAGVDRGEYAGESNGAWAGQGAQPNVPRGWESAMQRIGSMPLPGTNPFEGKTAVDTSAGAPGAATGPLSGLFSRSTTPMPGLPNGSGRPHYPQPSSPTQNVPNYLPPPQPAPYSTPYVAPYSTPGNVARPVAASGGYGPDTSGSSQSGGPAARRCSLIRGKGRLRIRDSIRGNIRVNISPGAGQYQPQAQQPNQLISSRQQYQQQPYQQQQPYPAQYQQAQQQPVRRGGEFAVAHVARCARSTGERSAAATPHVFERVGSEVETYGNAQAGHVA